MLHKVRTKSNELLILESLNLRMSLSEKEKQHYLNLKKGYEGEVLFDSFTEKLTNKCIVLNDLLLKYNNTLFQIDSVIIHSNNLLFYEVKNLDGDYFFEADKLYKSPKTEIINPLLQLNKSETLLRQLLKQLGFNFAVKASIVFINPEFTLYQTPLNKPFIFPTQLKRHINDLDELPYNITNQHHKLAEKLISIHLDESPYNSLPSYKYDQIKKGITCSMCGSFSVEAERYSCTCLECGQKERNELVVLRNVKEIKLLFPTKSLTTKVVQDWSNNLITTKVIRNTLEKNYKKAGIHQWTYYI
ncbi:nuclease-related domain-containing protein [Fredinandcohnia sp. 179-A 10B2 NHS]|uniref:nuclease-related domain-containing protein n=1 Tax=Fredinandcohnia sp. 179-A 10B2 NHS TaxID=3235176 RepID=UPI0039A314AF